MIDVACAIIPRTDGKVLVARRGPSMSLPGLWEFPGGKLEAGESSGEALTREIEEELGIRIRLLRPLPPVEHDYPDFSIRLHPWICGITSGEPKPTEHAEIRWLDAASLPGLEWAAADAPVVNALLELAGAAGEEPYLRFLFGK